MGILSNNNSSDEEMIIRDNPKFVAERMIKTTQKVYQMLVKLFNDTSTMFWLNQQGFSPQQIADALGTDGKELFEIHRRLGKFLATINPEEIELGQMIVGEFEYNQNGSIKVIDSLVDTEEPTASTDNP